MPNFADVDDMALLLIAIILIVSVGLEVRRKGFFDDSLKRESADAIKGVFILLIVVSHAMGYYDYCGYTYSLPADGLARKGLLCLGQLVVVMFLFLSGYGVMEQWKQRGRSYVVLMPRRRVLTTLLNFDVAVVVFAIASVAMGSPVQWRQMALSLVAWESVGNSNWYIFAILLCYVAAWLSLRFCRAKGWQAVAACTMILLLAMAVLQMCKPPMWSDTLLSFPAGMAWSLLGSKAVAVVHRRYAVCLVASMAAFSLLYILPLNAAGLRPNLMAVAFALMVVVVVQKVRPGGKVLRWCGSHLFPLYIYQRLPMMVVATLWPSWVAAHAVLFVVVTFAVTVVIAHYYHYWQIRL